MFNQLELLPADPILGLITRFKEDNNPNKVDLGVGVYKNEAGQTPVMQAVAQAEARVIQQQTTKAYIGPKGPESFNTLMTQMVLGEGHSAVTENRVSMVQTPGGCGALRVAAELILRANPKASIWVSDPTWGNHIPLLGDSGLNIKTYPYYDFDAHAINVEKMMACLAEVPAGDLVLLHGSCHNPSGADLSPQQWQSILELAQAKGFIPFVDMAYQGFANGVEEDAYGFRLLAENLPECILALSCSKNFGLYRERVGAIAVVSPGQSRADIITSHIASIVRGIYSMPPSHGALIVAEILADAKLSDLWQQELAEMRQRLFETRATVAQKLQATGFGNRYDFLANEKGMFSFLGLASEQVETLAQKFGWRK